MSVSGIIFYDFLRIFVEEKFIAYLWMGFFLKPYAKFVTGLFEMK